VICGEGVDGGRIAEVEDAGAVVIPVELDAEGELAKSPYGVDQS